MTHHKADDFSSETPEPVTDAQLASEPALPALRAFQHGAAEHDALARRIAAAADAELARRREVRLRDAQVRDDVSQPARGPRLVVVPGGRRVGRREDLAPVIARALRPALLAAAAAGLFAIGLAGWGTSATPALGQELSDASAVQALSLHDPNAQWPDQARAPSVDALGRAIGLGGAP